MIQVNIYARISDEYKTGNLKYVDGSAHLKIAKKDSLNFTNDNVDYSKFEQQYEIDKNKDPMDSFIFIKNEAKDSAGRKYKAIPHMVYGLFQTIGHLFLSAIAIVTLETDISKASLFSAARDLEEVYGNFMVFFNDKLGLYYIQQAQFQKACYYAFINENSHPSSLRS